MQVQVQSNTSTFPRTRAQSYQTCEYFKSPTNYFQYPHKISFMYLKKRTLILFLQYPHQVGFSCLKKLTLILVNTSADFERQVHSQVGNSRMKSFSLTADISFIFTSSIFQYMLTVGLGLERS